MDYLTLTPIKLKGYHAKKEGYQLEDGSILMVKTIKNCIGIMTTLEHKSKDKKDKLKKKVTYNYAQWQTNGKLNKWLKQPFIQKKTNYSVWTQGGWCGSF